MYKPKINNQRVRQGKPVPANAQRNINRVAPQSAFQLSGSAELLSIVRNTVSANYVRVFNESLTRSRLNGLVNFREISPTERSYEYTPKRRRGVVMGDVNPSTCDSSPIPVNVYGTEPVWGKTEIHEESFHICISDCTTMTPRQKTLELLGAVTDVLAGYLTYKFWMGNPQRLQYGLLNHPNITTVPSPSTGTNGSSRWATKTNAQIMQEIRMYSRYMVNPRILVSEAVYNEALINGDTDTGTDRGCKLRIDCIKRLLADQPDLNFTMDSKFEFFEELDRLAAYANSSVVLIYDADSLYMTSSAPIMIDPYQISGKKVEQIIALNTGGIEIEYTNAAFLLTGV